MSDFYDNHKTCGDISCDECNERYEVLVKERDELREDCRVMAKYLFSESVEEASWHMDEVCQIAKKYMGK